MCTESSRHTADNVPRLAQLDEKNDDDDDDDNEEEVKGSKPGSGSLELQLVTRNRPSIKRATKSFDNSFNLRPVSTSERSYTILAPHFEENRSLLNV